jgi:hypothetical protein
MSHWSIGYPADERYISTALENSVQLVARPTKLVSLEVFNSSGGVLYVAVIDTALGATLAALEANADVMWRTVDVQDTLSISYHGGRQFKNGIFVAAFAAVYSKAYLIANPATANAGNVLWFEMFHTRGYLPNPAAVPAAGGTRVPPFTAAGGEAA